MLLRVLSEVYGALSPVLQIGKKKVTVLDLDYLLPYLPLLDLLGSIKHCGFFKFFTALPLSLFSVLLWI